MSCSLVKRAMQARGYTREWRKPKHAGKAYPYRVLDPEGEPIAFNWGQAAVHASRLARLAERARDRRVG